MRNGRRVKLAFLTHIDALMLHADAMKHGTPENEACDPVLVAPDFRPPRPPLRRSVASSLIPSYL